MRDLGASILFSPAPGETIKKVRKGIEANQEDMARLLGLRRETLSRIETGVIQPTASFIRRFSKIASTVKVFRDINALKEASPTEAQIPFSPTFIRSHFSFSPAELELLMELGNASYNKTKKKVLRRIRI